ncbi:MAG: hypothetical protein IJ498_06815 [Akkermansia sp.]|nr:hypothetical protein [Akkermansia sp.]
MKGFVIAIPVLLALGCDEFCPARTHQPPAIAAYPASELDAEILAVCINDYKKRYRAGRELKNYLRFDYRVLAYEEAARHRFLQQPQLEPGQRYVLVTICDLPPRRLGGSAEYLVEPKTRKILAWSHGK